MHNIHIIKGGTPNQQREKAIQLAHREVSRLAMDFEPDDFSIPAPGVLRNMAGTHNVVAAVNFYLPATFAYLTANVLAWAQSGIPVILSVADTFTAPAEWNEHLQFHTL